MGRRVNKIAKAAHIKRNTEGTSNEISFSVLDAAKNRLDGADGKRSNPFGSVSLFTLPGKKKSVSTPSKDEGLALKRSAEQSNKGASSHGEKKRGKAQRVKESRHAASSKGTPRASAADMVAARKTRRKRGKFLTIAVIAVVACAAIGSFGWWGYNEFTTQQQSKASLQSAFSSLQPVDDELAEIDDCMTRVDDGEAISLSLDEIGSLAERLEKDEGQMKSILSSASDAAHAALQPVGDAQAGNVSEQTDTAISSREQMFSSGKSVVESLRTTLQAKEKATSAWQQLLAGDAAAREAASLVANATEGNIASSTEKANEAIELFNKSLDLFTSASALYPKADFSAYTSYLDKRVEAQGYAIASNDALASKDTATATDQNDRYNRADEEAAALAEKLPDDPIEVLSTLFENDAQEDRAAYGEAQVAARAADAFISDYLGAPSK